MEDTAPLRTSTVTLPPLPRTHGNAPDNATIATDRRSLLKKRAAVIVGLLALTAGLAGFCVLYGPELLAFVADAPRFRAWVDETGWISRIVFVLANMAQVVFAFLPGEPLELGAGYAFGFWEGTLWCLVASALGTAAVMALVRAFGIRIVGLFFSPDKITSMRWLRDSRRFEMLLFLCFLIPGTPKDLLTYVAGLGSSSIGRIVAITTVGRIPSIVSSTLAAGAFGDGNYLGAALVIALTAVLAAAGVGTWIYQLMNGLGVTGMNNSTSWGLYITCFMFFVGLSAGGLIVASSASVFHIAQFKKVAVPAIILSTVCICCAGMFVLIDLGGIQRVWRIVTGPNVTSPLFWDICVISCYLVINLVYLYFMTSKRADKSKIAIVSRFALPIAILVHTVTAWIFGLQIAREGWHSAIMGPLFVASAMDSGLALLLIALAWMNRRGIWETSKKLMGMLAGLLATCIAVDGYMVGCELLTTGYPGSEGGWHVLSQMFFGATAPYFWIEIIVGVLIPFTILVFAKNRQKTGLIVFSSACVVVGVFCKRVWLLFTAFVHPNVYGAPGISSGSSAGVHAGATDIWSTLGVYAPTWVEIVVVVGAVSLGALAFLVLASKLLKPSDEPETAPRETAAQVA